MLVLLGRRWAGLWEGLAADNDEFAVVDDAVEREDEEEVLDAFDCDRGFCCFLGLSLR